MTRRFGQKYAVLPPWARCTKTHAFICARDLVQLERCEHPITGWYVVTYYPHTRSKISSPLISIAREARRLRRLARVIYAVNLILKEGTLTELPVQFMILVANSVSADGLVDLAWGVAKWVVASRERVGN